MEDTPTAGKIEIQIPLRCRRHWLASFDVTLAKSIASLQPPLFLQNDVHHIVIKCLCS